MSTWQDDVHAAAEAHGLHVGRGVRAQTLVAFDLFIEGFPLRLVCYEARRAEYRTSGIAHNGGECGPMLRRLLAAASALKEHGWGIV